MTSRSACETTHRQIRFGPCPWCGRDFLEGQPAQHRVKQPFESWVAASLELEETPEEMNPVPHEPGRANPSETVRSRWWDIPRMVADLEDGDDQTRLDTATNLAEHPPALDDALRLARRAMADPLEAVTELAERAVCRLSRALSVDDLPRHEARLKDDPSDLATLTLVLWVYFSAHSQSEAVGKAQQRLMLWVIETMPRARVAGLPLVSASWDLDFLAHAKRLWLAHVESNPRDARLIANAAKFFKLHDKPKCEQLFLLCKEIEPDNPEWSWQLGSCYSRRKRRRSRPDEPDRSALSQAEYERVLALAPDSNWAALVLPHLANYAFAAGNLDQARDYGERMLAHVSKALGAGTKGTMIHLGQTILGRVALARGDTEQAKARLLSAVNDLDARMALLFASHGPSTALAKDLLEHGERATVLAYFRECAERCTTKSARLARWTKIIEQGGVPDFEALPSWFDSFFGRAPVRGGQPPGEESDLLE